MALSPRLDLRQTQSLVMTPQLQQAIKLLQLSNMELSEFVEQELEQNPLLERDHSDPAPSALSETPEAPLEARAEPEFTESATAVIENGENFSQDDVALWQAEGGVEGGGDVDFAGDADAWKSRLGGNGTGGLSDDLPGLEEVLRQDISLREHLVGQLNCDIDDPVERMVGLHLIDLLDESGYLTADLDEAAALLRCPMELIETVLRRLQRFDPAGVFARNLKECLGIQLAERNRLDPAMQTLLDNLPMLANREINALIRLCGIDAEDFADMIAEIKALNPKPGLGFEGAPIQAVVPDILMRALPDGGWSIELNTDTLPRVLVNSRYFAKVSKGAQAKEEREYLSERFQSANWLVKSLHQRANTILRVATEIVRQQDAFFIHGVSFLRPLILRDIAEAIGMHESTVSRVTTNKYMATPRGLFELKYFFTSAIQGTAGTGTHSAEAVRFRIKSLIDAEPANAILSDDRIVEILLESGIDIARRTVAKYREAMRIPSSVMRRREKSMRI
ncbi:MAG TPA: RNA polymerase factor sigma-54 [Stellaceae bacterium]|nr:RNA polymerase factor sigma-54 [Stellaceae bacterium]